MAGGGEGGPAKESIFVSVLNKIDEAYNWVKAKLNSLFKLFSESITEALLGLRSFVTSCCEKLRKVLSGINTRLDKLFGKKMVVGVVPEESCLLAEMKMLVPKMRASVEQCLGVGNSLEMKAAHLKSNWFLDLVEGFIELLEYAYKQPLTLIPVLLDGYLIYRSSYKKAGGVRRAVRGKGKAAMAIFTLINLIVPSTILF
ncbi:hypothetical protein PVL29_006747 [Vitis rotundifolia]|uniref:Uncharacterized protein n=1 Tax=Vitis rotundifolia TaxID=103349 RepID=A0AA39A5T0_VITRO|nr:hypothetical protein PVL29_006747 [Vitis rotundifolia]